MADHSDASTVCLDEAPTFEARYRRVQAIEPFDILHAAFWRHTFAPHTHEFFVIGVIETGHLRIRIRDVMHEVVAGDILCFPPEDVHSAEAIDDEPWTYRMLYPSARMVDMAIHGTGASMRIADFPTPIIRDPQTAAALLRLHTALWRHDDQLRCEASLIGVLGDLVRRHAQVVPERPECDGERIQHAGVRRVRDYLDAHFVEMIRLETLAAIAGVSPFHLVRVFRRAMGIPPYAYLEQLRVRQARRLLTEGCTVTEAAYASGFCDQSHLGRHFKRVFGVPPGRYVRDIGARRSAARRS